MCTTSDAATFVRPGNRGTADLGPTESRGRDRRLRNIVNIVVIIIIIVIVVCREKRRRRFKSRGSAVGRSRDAAEPLRDEVESRKYVPTTGAVSYGIRNDDDDVSSLPAPS